MSLIGQISHDSGLEGEQMWSRKHVESSEEETRSLLSLSIAVDHQGHWWCP